jgi:hypothetical protein
MSSAGVNTPEEQAERQHFITFHAVQTHFFDAYCVAASTAGIDQDWRLPSSSIIGGSAKLTVDNHKLGCVSETGSSEALELRACY